MTAEASASVTVQLSTMRDTSCEVGTSFESVRAA